MPYYVAPETPEDRLFVLEETQKFTTAESQAQRPVPITAVTLTGVASFLPIYQPLVTTLRAKLGDRSREVSEATTARTTLGTYTRDYIDVLNRRTIRLKHPAAVLIHHGLPESWASLKQTAEALIAGDALNAARRETDPGQRRLLRMLGYTFKPFPGETPEPVDPTLPTTPNIPPAA